MSVPAGHPSSSIVLSAPAVHGPFPEAITTLLNGSGEDRAQGLVRLEAFILDLFTFKFSRAFFIALLTAACFLALLVVVGCECDALEIAVAYGSLTFLPPHPKSAVVIMYRIWNGKFWVVRFMRRSEGKLDVANYDARTMLLTSTLPCRHLRRTKRPQRLHAARGFFRCSLVRVRMGTHLCVRQKPPCPSP